MAPSWPAVSEVSPIHTKSAAPVREVQRRGKHTRPSPTSSVSKPGRPFFTFPASVRARLLVSRPCRPFECKRSFLPSISSSASAVSIPAQMLVLHLDRVHSSVIARLPPCPIAHPRLFIRARTLILHPNRVCSSPTARPLLSRVYWRQNAPNGSGSLIVSYLQLCPFERQRLPHSARFCALLCKNGNGLLSFHSFY